MKIGTYFPPALDTLRPTKHKHGTHGKAKAKDADQAESTQNTQSTAAPSVKLSDQPHGFADIETAMKTVDSVRNQIATQPALAALSHNFE